MTNYANIRYQPAAASTTTVADMAALIALTGMSNGDQALVQATNKLYMYSGTGWYLIATIQNDAPSAITGVSGTYELAIDGTATTITAASTDPEGFPLTWSYSTSGLGSIATVSNTDNVFTITPSTTEADAGTFTLTINATDGVNGAVSTSTNLTLEFIVIVTNSKYTTLLATAVDTSDNNNITDSSSNNHSITVNGDAHAGTFSPYRHGGYSTYFDGSDYLQLSATATDLLPETTDTTIEAWVNTTGTGHVSVFSNFNPPSPFNGMEVGLYNGYQTIYSQGSWINNTGGTGVSTINDGSWHHLAWVITNSGATVTTYVDGVQNYTSSITASTTGSSNQRIGASSNSTVNRHFTGYISDVRFVKGTAVYTSNFTPPTERLTTITSTSLLTCHLPYIVDGSTNAHSITVNGNTSVKPFSPYDYLEYAAADNGGSINFDGTGDYLTIPDHSSLNFASNDWTIECWIYPRTNVSDCGIWHQSADGTDWYSIYLDGAFNLKFVFYNASNGVEWAGTAASNTAPQNTWTHVALVRQFGTGVYLYANGKLVASDTLDASVTMLDKTYDHIIGYQRFVGSGNAFDGLISDFKIDVGTAHYTAEFTPPTAPLSSTGAELHIKGTDASIIDKSQKRNLAVNNPNITSTTQTKFANTVSMYFDGTYSISTGESLILKTLNTPFTGELWLYPTNVASGGQIIAQADSPNPGRFWLNLETDGRIRFYWNGASDLYSTNSVSDNQWHHIAFVRKSNGYLAVYVNGTETELAQDNNNRATDGSITRIGSSGPSYFPNYIQGYIQDVRLTDGVARYTANFTPPTAPLEG